MIQEEMNALVPQKLKEMERVCHITVLWAVESGSRAWGFASPDSDFDVRFIYKRTPQAYLALNPGRDVIELPVDDTWDVSGWDLDKALKLLQKSNPTLYEWFQSPIRYYETGFSQRIASLMKECFSEKRMLHHYLNTAKQHMKDYLRGDTLKPKQYFYALRPILACEWIRTEHTAPPVPFSELCRAVLPAKMTSPVEHLLDLKMNHPERAEISPIQEIDEFLNEQVSDIEHYLKTIVPDVSPQWDHLNEFFWNEIHRS